MKLWHYFKYIGIMQLNYTPVWRDSIVSGITKHNKRTPRKDFSNQWEAYAQKQGNTI